MSYIDPITGATIGNIATKGTSADSFRVMMAWQPSTLSYIALSADVSGNLNVTGGGGGGGNPAAGLTGAAVPTYGDYLAFSGAGGLLTGVSAANPLPCTFTGSAGNAAAGATGVAPPGYADYTGWVSGGNLIGTSLTTGLPVQPGTGTTWTVAGSGTFTVAGTVTANQGGAPWTMKPDGTVWTLTGTSANVNVTNASLPVTGTFWQATQPVSGTVTANQGGANATPWNENVAQFGGSAVVTGTGVGGAGIPRVTVSSDSFPATQAVSGTVTATQGTPPWTVKPDGTAWSLTGTSANVNVTNTSIAVTGSGSFTVAGTVTSNQGSAGATPWLSNVTHFGSNNVVTGTGVSGVGIPRVTVSSDSFPASQAVTGTFWQATQPVSIAATVPVQGTTTPANGSAIPTTAVPAAAVLMVTNQATGLLDLVEEGDNTADGDIPGNTGLLGAEVYPKMYDDAAGAFQRQRGTIRDGLKVQNTADQNLILPVLQAILTELRVMNVMLQQGLNVKDDPEDFRQDPFYNANVTVQ